LARKSGKKSFKRPGLSETVGAALRLVRSRQWSNEEMSEAFDEDVGWGSNEAAVRELLQWSRVRTTAEGALRYWRETLGFAACEKCFTCVL